MANASVVERFDQTKYLLCGVASEGKGAWEGLTGREQTSSAGGTLPPGPVYPGIEARELLSSITLTRNMQGL